MAIHDEVLEAARRICRERGAWTFTAEEVVRALPDLNAHSIRTHVASRCCTNAPRNHPHKWGYFKRVRRGVYEIHRAYRRSDGPDVVSRVAEPRARYGPGHRRDSVHATIFRGERDFVGECWELAVVSQGRTLDEVVANLRDALALHLEGEDLEVMGLDPSLRLVVTYESSLQNAPSPPTALR